jgi:predicted transport protein
VTSLSAAVQHALDTAEKLKQAGSGNEANTRALVIDPVLSALGWNLMDFDVVHREYAVYDGTFLDYALKIDGAPRLFVEAKAVGKSLSDPKFVSQTINYANNEGVVWCVLTNGLTYRVYKTNEPVPMDGKLLFEASLQDAANGRLADVVASLSRIGRSTVASDGLDDWGERKFTDLRVRKALQQLAAAAPDTLLDLVEQRIAKPVPDRTRVVASLRRILDVAAAAAPDPAGVPSEPPRPPVDGGPVPPLEPKPAPVAGGPADPPAKAVYAMDHHTANRSAVVVELLEQLDEHARQRGEDVVRKIGKVSVNYFAGKRPFCSLKTLAGKVVLFLVLDPDSTVPTNPVAMRDLRGIGHHGNGDVEYSVTSDAQLDEARSLIEQAYQAAK